MSAPSTESERAARREEERLAREREREAYNQRKRERLRPTPHICDPVVGSVLGALDQMEFRQAWQHTKELVACLRVNGFDIPERRQLEERIEADRQRDESK